MPSNPFARVRSKGRHRPLGPFVEQVTEAGTACLITMVQGNLLALTLGHWLIASRTGVITGTIATGALLLTRVQNRWLVAGMLALTTLAVDYASHPSHFGGAVGEAVVTGTAAGVLSLLSGMIWKRLKGAFPRDVATGDPKKVAVDDALGG